MSMKTVRRLAAKIWRSGKSRVRILDTKRASEALTSEDVKQLIADKAVILLQKTGVSRGAGRDKAERKAKGRRSGPGSRKGSQFAGTSAKDLWMRKVRAQRRLLKSQKGKISKSDYRDAYRMVKGNAFLSKKRLEDYLAGKAKESQGEKA